MNDVYSEYYRIKQSLHNNQFKNNTLMYNCAASVLNMAPIKYIRLLLYCTVLTLLPGEVQSLSMSVTSASPIVGISTNYTLTITNHSKPVKIRIQFSQWTPWQTQPYTSNYQFYLNSGSFSNVLLSCVPRFGNVLIECSSPTPTTQLGPTLQLRITNVNNPSSTKPYPITVILIYADTTSETVTSNLTVTTISNSNVTLNGYNSTVGIVSSTVTWIMSFDYYFDYGTVLRLVYNSNLITLGYSSLTGVVASTLNNSNIITAKLTNWSDTAGGVHLINYISVTNPQAALSTTVSCTLQFTQSNITYSIQSYTATFNIIPAAFTSMVGTTSMQMGLTAQTISILTLSCQYSAVDRNSSNDVSYTEITYSTVDIPTSTCSTPTTINSTKTCRFSSTISPKSITDVTQAITTNTMTVATITAYTYYPALNAYTPLCSQTYNITLLPQQIVSGSINFNTALCGTGTTGQLNNNSRLVVKVDSAAAGDIVTVSLAMGLMAGSWTRVTNTTTYKYTLVAADLLNSTHISIRTPYTNPTYTTTSNYMNALTLSRIMSNSTQTVYGRTNPTNLSISICPVTTASQLQSFTISLSNTTTYSATTTIIRYKNKFTDYVDTDYLRIQYKFYDNLLYLTTPQIAANISVKLTTNGANSNCVTSVVNNTILNINNISRINTVGIINQMQVLGIVNPSAIYPIVTGATGFQIIITLITAAGLEKEQATAQFSSPSTQTSYAYTVKTNTVVQSVPIPILKSGISLALSLNNSLKSKYYPSMPTTNVSIKLPFTCTQTDSNGTMFTPWQSFSSILTVNLSNCNIGYLNSTSVTISISQYLTNGNITVPSTQVLYTANLACKDNCLQCLTSKYCTSCVNSTFIYYLLYGGLCYSTCPQKTYHPDNQPICQSCHPSCLTCNGSSMTSCTSCQANYFAKPVNISTQQGVTQFQNICVSVCGEGKSLNINTNVCQSCQIDCKYCIDSEYCYFCKSGATQVTNGKCDFTVCTDPCKSCEGSMINCTSCINQMYLYQFQCYTTCPANTYPNITAGQPNICMDITVPTLYFPITICSIVLIVLVCICNTCIERGLTADTQRRNINMLSYSSSILAIMELFALFIMIASTFTASSRGLGIAGLLLWIICNILFGVYYFKVIRNDQAVIPIVDKMTSQTKCIYYATVGFSVVIALRLYRVLYCGLFRGVAPYPVKKKIDSAIRNRKPSEGRIANENVEVIIQQNQPPVAEPAKPEKDSKNGKATSMSMKTIKNVDIASPPPVSIPKATPVDKNEVIQQQGQNTSQQSTEEHSKFQLKRPYIIYITIGSLLASILFLAAGISEITKNSYPAMLFWGLDILIVVTASVIVTVLDMWAGVKKSYLMALDKGPVNQTMENLRADEDQATHQKILTNAKATQKMNKLTSPTKKKGDDQKKSQRKKYQLPPNLIRKKSTSPKEKVLSPQQKQLKQKNDKLKSLKSRYSDLYKRSKKPEEDSESNDQDQLPDIKVFEDIQIFPNDEVQPKKIKKVKADNKRMTSMQNFKKNDNRASIGQSSNATLAKNNKMNWKMEDIFLGFKDEDGSEIDNKTVKLAGDRNETVEREIYKIERKKEEKSEESGQDYINSLERQRNRKGQGDEEDEQSKDQNKFNFE